MIARRDVELLVVSLVAGPPIGGAVLLGIVMLGDALTGATGQTLRSFLGALPMVVTASYMFGLVPALLSAIATAILSRSLAAPRQRCLAAFATGAAASLLCLGWLVFQPGGGTPAPLFLLILAVAGAVPALASAALIECFGSPLPPSRVAG